MYIVCNFVLNNFSNICKYNNLCFWWSINTFYKKKLYKVWFRWPALYVCGCRAKNIKKLSLCNASVCHSHMHQTYVVWMSLNATGQSIPTYPVVENQYCLLKTTLLSKRRFDDRQNFWVAINVLLSVGSRHLQSREGLGGCKTGYLKLE